MTCLVLSENSESVFSSLHDDNLIPALIEFVGPNGAQVHGSRDSFSMQFFVDN